MYKTKRGFKIFSNYTEKEYSLIDVVVSTLYKASSWIPVNAINVIEDWVRSDLQIGHYKPMVCTTIGSNMYFPFVRIGPDLFKLDEDCDDYSDVEWLENTRYLSFDINTMGINSKGLSKSVHWEENLHLTFKSKEYILVHTAIDAIRNTSPYTQDILNNLTPDLIKRCSLIVTYMLSAKKDTERMGYVRKLLKMVARHKQAVFSTLCN